MSDSKFTFVFDVDGTLCPIKDANTSYADLVPYADMVEKLRAYHEQGARIVLYTSRQMRTYRGDLAQIFEHTKPVLEAWLAKWDIPYDEVVYGKVWPGHKGFYVDDRTIRPDEFLNYSTDELEALCAAARPAAWHEGAGADGGSSEADAEAASSTDDGEGAGGTGAGSSDAESTDSASSDAGANSASSTAADAAAPDSIDVVITMGGLGSRFRKRGYTVPKYMIPAKGKTLFEWSLISLEGYRDRIDRYVFLAMEDPTVNVGGFVREKCAALGITNYDLVLLDHLTDGQATTALLAKPYWTPSHALLVYNIDTYVEPGKMNWQELKGDGFIPCFRADGDHWSFVRLNDAGRVVEIKEKQRISPYCTLGAYYFRTCQLYENLYHEYYDVPRDDLVNGEKYIAPLYDYLLSKGGDIYISDIDPARVHVLGTPEELEAFLNEGSTEGDA